MWWRRSGDVPSALRVSPRALVASRRWDCLRQIHDFAARGVVVLLDIVDGSKNVGEMRSGERHGLDAAEIERAVRSYQIERRLGEARRLLEPGRGHAAP